MGFLCRHLTAFGAEVWATDVSVEAVSAANSQNRGVDGFHGARSLEEAIATGQSFDRIISVEVVEHLNDEELANFFTTLLTLLAPDGLVIITTPNEENLALSEIYCPQCDHVFHRWQHLRSFSSESLSRKISEHGLEIVDIYTTDFARGRMPNVWKSIKSNVKRLIGQKRRLPHLVCVARARHM
jgi:2-polyprenyl-3-methyl-5-hydroxy-6-metoxy-1,4-benzoquinol methylase